MGTLNSSYTLGVSPIGNNHPCSIYNEPATSELAFFDSSGILHAPDYATKSASYVSLPGNMYYNIW